MKDRLAFAGLWLVAVAVAVSPIVRANARERGAIGLRLSPQEVKQACGAPQTEAGLRLTYFEGRDRATLEFVLDGDRSFLNQVRSESLDGTRSSVLTHVSTVPLEDYALRGFIPKCVANAAR